MKKLWLLAPLILTTAACSSTEASHPSAKSEVAQTSAHSEHQGHGSAVGPSARADEVVSVVATDGALKAPKTVPAGAVQFSLHNMDVSPHDLIIFDGPVAQAPFASDGHLNLDDDPRILGHIGGESAAGHGVPQHKTGWSKVVDLEPGRYTVSCSFHEKMRRPLRVY